MLVEHLVELFADILPPIMRSRSSTTAYSYRFAMRGPYWARLAGRGFDPAVTKSRWTGFGAGPSDMMQSLFDVLKDTIDQLEG